jgi:carbamoyltransferase
VALNCVANGRILREGPFKRLWIQPAAGDRRALGAAQLAWHRHLKGPRRLQPGRDAMHGAALGPLYTCEEIESWLVPCQRRTKRSSDPNSTGGAAMLADGKVVGWFDGRMEFGPAHSGSVASWATRGIRACRPT